MCHWWQGKQDCHVSMLNKICHVSMLNKEVTSLPSPLSVVPSPAVSLVAKVLCYWGSTPPLYSRTFLANLLVLFPPMLMYTLAALYCCSVFLSVLYIGTLSVVPTDYKHPMSGNVHGCVRSIIHRAVSLVETMTYLLNPICIIFWIVAHLGINIMLE